ncbi:MAG: hypothetical protein P4N24_19115 [Acidobacteriota bacterium]|nr:hypothetical protein [Acidobacteriota bacterium]
MRKLTLPILCFLSIALAIAPPGQGPKSISSGLASLMPPGSLLFMESPNFAALVHDWEKSSTEKKWLASDNYRVFSRSRLFLRLQEAQTQFAVAAGAPPDMALLDSLAGEQSALALYDVGNLEFLYITRMPSARAMQNVLWTNRAKFEPRKAADIPYYVRTEREQNRVVAFATSGDYLLLATREDLIAGALAIISGKSQPVLQDEDWYKSVVSQAGAVGDLRMVLNMPRLVKSPHFRTYWIERNITELKSYSAEVADIHRSETEIREDRVLIKVDASGGSAPQASAGAPIGELLSMVPSQEGIYRAWSKPAADTVRGLLELKILSPHAGPGAAVQTAPDVSLNQSEAGSESDLETRIDEAPLQGTADAPGTETLKKLLNAAPIEATLEFQKLGHVGQSSFIEPHSAVLIYRSANWNSETVRSALREAIDGQWTTSQIGVNWVEHHQGNRAFYQLDGLVPLAIATEGPILMVADSPVTLNSLLVPSQIAGSGKDVIYAGGFRHVAERENMVRMMRFIEMPPSPQSGSPQGQPGREPLFFSENLASLSRSLGSVESESIVVEDRGTHLQQTVTYRLGK